MSKRWLPLGWKLMVAFGFFYVALGVLVPFQSYFALPAQPMIVFGPVDEKFTGLSWGNIMSFSPALGSWMVLSMVSMCGMMIIGGVLTVSIARHAYRNGERWAWRALLVANLLSLAYYIFFIGGFHAARGIYFWNNYPGSSGFGADLVVVITLIWLFLGLWLPRRELKSS